MEAVPGRHAALFEVRDALTLALIEAVPAAVPFYATLSPAALRATAERVIDLFFDALEEYRPEKVRAWGIEVYGRRQEQGARLGDVVRSVSTVRRVLCRAAKRTLEGAVAEEAVEIFEEVAEELTATGVGCFEEGSDIAARAIEAIEERYRGLYRRTPAMMHSIDSSGRITAVSDRWLEYLGYTEDEVLGRRSVDFLTPESRKLAVEVNIPLLREAGRRFGIPYEFVKKNGEVIEVRLSSAAIRDETGEVVQFVAVFDDVTEENRAKRELEESEERWRVLMDLTPMPLTIHRGGVITWMNDACAQLFGGKAEEFVGLNGLDLVHPEDRPKVIERVRQSAASKEPLPPMEQRYLRRDGSTAYVEVAARQIAYRNEPAVITATVDVTVRRQAEEARRVAESQEAIIRAQEEALRALSTPLMPIGEGVLVLPLVGRVGPERAEGILTALAEGVVAQGARVAIVDVTGVPEADAAFAESLLRVGQAIKLLGAEVVITGVKPAIARMLVELGADLSGVRTRATLRDAVAHSMRKLWR